MSASTGSRPTKLKWVFILREATGFNGDYGSRPEFEYKGFTTSHDKAVTWTENVPDNFTVREYEIIERI